MSDKELKSYKRVHKSTNPAEVEKGKIEKETIHQRKYAKRSKDLTRDVLRNIQQDSDLGEELFEEIEVENYKYIKEKGNATTHKKRLKKLNKYDEFL